MADEYITLASDASSKVFPNNKIGQFRVKLPKKIYIDRQRHQIGLKYISFPHRTRNVEDGWFTLSVLGVGGTGVFSSGVPPGNYTPTTLTDALNEAIKQIESLQEEKYRPVLESGVKLSEGIVGFVYHPTTEKISFHYKKTPLTEDGLRYRFRVRLSVELMVKMGLGLPDDHPYFEPTLESGASCTRRTWADCAPHTVDLNLGQTSIFVYTDIVEKDRTVGDRLSPLLSIVPFEGVHGTQVHFEPRIVEYCTPRYDVIDEINIELLNELAQPMKFTSGKVYVTLHIRDKFA